MKKTIFLILSLVAATLAGGCKQEGDPFAFTVKSDSVAEGEPLPFTVSVTRGGHDGYLMDVEVFRYDLSSGRKEAVEDVEVLCADGPLKGRVNFEDYGRKDFLIPGLSAGTYLVSVTLSKDGFALEGSAVSVVFKKQNPGGGDGPDGPGQQEDKDIYVDAFSIPSLPLADGTFVADVGTDWSFVLQWTPANANMLDFTAASSNDNVVVATTSGGLLHLSTKNPGEAQVTVSAPGGAAVGFTVVVKKTEIAVDDFEVLNLDMVDGRVVLSDPQTLILPLQWTPADATKLGFKAVSSNKDVVETTMDGNSVVLKSVAPGDATVTVTADGGLSRSFPVRVRKSVKVTVEWQENDASDAQIATKTFPCNLVIRSDSKTDFPTTMTFVVTFKGVINVTGKDTQSVVVKKELNFTGAKMQLYNVTEFLNSCYLVYRTSDYSLSITMTLQFYDSIDRDYWDIEIDEKYKTQDARINDYIVSFQQ